MIKALKALVESTKNARIGNHAVMVQRGTRSFSYHGNTICMVDDALHRVYLTNAGWNTSSTSRAINEYSHYFVEAQGYEEVTEIFVKKEV